MGLGHILENFGPIGLCLFVLFFVLKHFFEELKVYRDDRVKWLKDSEKMSTRMITALNTHSKFLSMILKSLKKLEIRLNKERYKNEE